MEIWNSNYYNFKFKIKLRKFGIGQAQNSKCEPRFPRTATEDELRAAFAAYGTLESVSIVKKDSKLTGEAYGFANFIEHEAAVHCLEALKNGAVILKDANGNPKVVKGKWAHKSKQFELRVGRHKA